MLDPAQVGLDMKELIVNEQTVAQRGRTPGRGELPHHLQMRIALHIKVIVRGPARHQGQHHLLKQHRLELWLLHAAAALALATGWRFLVGRGPLELVSTWVSTAVARATVRS